MAEAASTGNSGVLPIAEAERIVALDVLRGVALFGILVVNMEFFAGPFTDIVIGEPPASGESLDRAAWAVREVFFTGKFISLFSLLFGAGIALQAARLDRTRGESATTRLLFRRLAVLAAVGLAHAVFVWYGDILWTYATLGWILIPARAFRTRTLAILGAGLLLFSLCCATGFGLADALQSSPEGAEPAEEVGVEVGDQFGDQFGGELGGEFGIDLAWPVDEIPDAPTSLELFDKMTVLAGEYVAHSDWRAFEMATYRNGPAEVAMSLRTRQWFQTLPFVYLGLGPHLVGMFLLGAAAARAGAFSPEWSRWQGRAAMIALPLGVAAAAIGPVLLLSGRSSEDRLVAGATGFEEFGATALSIGYAALLSLFAARGPKLVTTALARTGRMAFTIYLSMSVAMTGLFYWWGGALFGTVSEAPQMGIAVLTWIGFVLVAHMWLRFCVMGPLEWLWRAGTYLTWPGLVRRDSRGGGAEP